MNCNSFDFNTFNDKVIVIQNIRDLEFTSKQINFLKDCSLSNYIFIVPVTIIMLNKGIPDFNSYVCLPTAEDIQHFKKTKNNKINSSNIINKLVTLKGDQDQIINVLDCFNLKDKQIKEKNHFSDFKNKKFCYEYNTIKHLNSLNDTTLYNSDIINRNYLVKLKEKTEREIIGFCTTGNYSYLNCKGSGKAFLSIDAYEKIITNKQINMLEENLVLIRHKKSKMYYFAKFKLI